MPPQRNMGWRKPVPKYIPDGPPISRLSSTSFKRMSFSQLNKEVPPLPDEFLQKLGRSLSKAKRHGFILDDQIDTRWIDQYRSHPVSFPTVQEDPSEEDLHSLFTNSSGREPHETAQTLPRVVRHKRSLPRHYRPPTPPLRREHPERRPRSTHQSAQQLVLPLPRDDHGMPASRIDTKCVRLTASPTPGAQVLPPYGTAKPVRHAQTRSGPAGASRTSSLHSRSLSTTSSALRARRHGQGIVTIWADVKTLGIQVRLRFHHLFR